MAVQKFKEKNRKIDDLFATLLRYYNKSIMTEQEDLLHRFNSKEEYAYHKLFLQFYSYLVLFADRKIENHKVAEDIVQDIFIKLWESDKQYNSLNGLKAYLYEAVCNRCADYQKHRLVEEKYAAFSLYEQKAQEHSVEQEEIYRELYVAISELPLRSREVILLYLEGKKNQEIAEVLNLSILTVKTHKKNAFRYLRKRLGNLLLLIILFKVEKNKVLLRKYSEQDLN